MRPLGVRNPAPKCCRQHMRHTTKMPAQITGLKLQPGQDIWRCKRCGRTTIKGRETQVEA